MAASVNLSDFKVDYREESGSPRAQHWDTFVDDIMAAQITRRLSLDIFKGITCFRENFTPFKFIKDVHFCPKAKVARSPLSTRSLLQAAPSRSNFISKRDRKSVV